MTTGISRNPSDTREVVAEYARADRNQTHLAIRAAADAFPHWSHTTPQRRADVLDQIGSEILARREELGMLLAREEGKTLPEAVGEAARAGHIFKFFAGEALRAGGEMLASVRPDVQVDITREPVGVVGLIAPWNFPLAIPAWKIAPALAYGNSVVFKPAELVPACGWALAEIISRAALPAGTFNLVMGSGREVGQAIVDHPLVDAISFTGSVPTGELILQGAARRRAKVQLEMGGKNPLVVLADADLDRAVDCALQGAYFSTGQRCTASSRLIVEASVHDAFVVRLRHRLAALKVGHALERGVDIGPVVDASQLEQNLAAVAGATEEGAEHVWGGERLQRASDGYFMSPALFLARPEHRVAREEIFGPVLSTLTFKDEGEAVAIGNSTIYGLAAAVWSRDVKKALRTAKSLKAGTVWVNAYNFYDPGLPFGGYKESGFGRERGHYALAEYTQVKSIWIDLT